MRARAEWRYASIMPGELYVILCSELKMLELYASKWEASIEMVSIPIVHSADNVLSSSSNSTSNDQQL